MPDPQPSLSEQRYALAEQLLGEWAAAANEQVAFDALVAAHPECAAELRELHRGVSHVDRGLDADAERVARERARIAELLKSLATARGFNDRYTIEGEFARGGMGVILSVVDRRLDRKLAMKVILGQADGKTTGTTPPVELRRISRFLNEARITGQLEHPGIVPVHEIGVDEQGRTYFTMKLVKGVTLEEAFARHAANHPDWTTARILDVLQRVCDALAFAHERRIIHRDLKPLNVMVGDFGEVYVMDWGLARRLDESPDERAAAELIDHELHPAHSLSLAGSTREGEIVGTPAYMSPEQARGAIAEIGPTADVYAIGAMLYRLIAGHAPYLEATDQKLSALALVERIKRETPAPLGRAAVAPELIAICEKAMKRDPSERYADMRGLAKDLRAHLDGRVVSAYETGAWAETRKWVTRNRSLAASVVIAVACVVAGSLISTRFWLDARRKASDLEVTAKDLEWQAYVANIRAASAAFDADDSSSTRRFLTAAPKRLRNFEWRLLDAATDASIMEFRGHEGAIYAVAFSPDGSRLLTASEDNTARVWDTATGTELHVLRGHKGSIWVAAFSPDGSRILTASDDKTARLWDSNTGAELLVLRGHENRVVCAAFSPDGSRILTASEDKTARLWDSDTGAELLVLRGHEGSVYTAGFTMDGSRIVTGSADSTLRVWDSATGAELHLLLGHENMLSDAAFSPDGSHLVTASGRGCSARLWDIVTGTELCVLRGHMDEVNSVAFSPDGSRILTASDDATVRLWDTATRTELHVLRGHKGSIWSATFSPDGSQIVTTSYDATARLWDSATGTELNVLRGHEYWVRAAAFSTDGSRIVTASEDKTARLWDTSIVAEQRVLSGHEDKVNSVSFSPDGSRIVTSSDDATARLWDTSTGSELHVLRGHGDSVNTAAFSPDGSRIVTTCNDDTIRLWDTDTGTELHVLRGVGSDANTAAFSPDGSRIITGGIFDTARVWDTATGAELHVLKGLEGSDDSTLFSPDGSRIVTASHAYYSEPPRAVFSVRIWDSATGTELHVLRGLKWVASFVGFSPDGSRIITLSGESTPQLWDTLTGSELRVVGGHEDSVNAAAYSPDGSLLVTASADRTVRLWDGITGAALHVLRGHEQSVVNAAFSPDGSRLVSTSHDSTARLWDTSTGSEVHVIRGDTDPVVTVAFSPDGSRLVTVSKDQTTRLWDSVANRVRVKEREPYRTAMADARRVLAAALVSAPTLAEVAKRIGGDPSLTPIVRRVALDLFLEQSNAWQEAAWKWICELEQVEDGRAAVAAVVSTDTDRPLGVHEHAHRLLALLEDGPEHWASLAWSDVCEAGIPPQRITRALRLAAAAVQLEPEDWDKVGTLGAAQYRNGLYSEAIETLRIATKLAERDRPTILAFLAMAHAQIGEVDVAKTYLARLRALISSMSPGDANRFRSWLDEPTALIERK